MPDSTPFIPARFMICTPHPDDTEIGAGGTAARWIREGADGILIVCTNGDKGSADLEMTSEELAAIREREQTEAAAVIGFKEVVFLRHPDGELEDNRAFRGELVREIRRHKPEVVLSVDPYRRGFYNHRDHRMTGTVTIDAVFPYARDHLHFAEHRALGLEPHKVANIYLWGSEAPDTYVDIGETIDMKIEALAKHVSQVGPPRDRDFGSFIRENAQRLAKDQGMEYAEAFRVMQLRR